MSIHLIPTKATLRALPTLLTQTNHTMKAGRSGSMQLVPRATKASASKLTAVRLITTNRRPATDDHGPFDGGSAA